jgi:flagellar assembly protein FliH
MVSPVIPKESLTAYQRWELLGFEERAPKAAPAPEEEALSAPLPTAEDLERIQQQAAQEGFQLGRDEGFRSGYEAGRKAAEAVAGQLGELADALDREQIKQDETVARELLGLALAVTKQMVRTAFKVKQDLILDVIREAMTSLPSLSGHLRILVHPDDVEPLREFMETEHGHLSFRVMPDSRIDRGGFRIESSHSEVDGQLPIRWREIIDCLGSDTEWLE